MYVRARVRACELHSEILLVKQTTPKEMFLIFLVTGCSADLILILDPADERNKRLEGADWLSLLQRKNQYCLLSS